jgi:hypothetical protein
VSKRIQLIFFLALGAILLGVVLIPPQKTAPAPHKRRVILNGDEVKPGDLIYADGRISLESKMLFGTDSLMTVSVRPKEHPEAPPIAVRTIHKPGFPFRLFITSGDNVVPGPPYQGDIYVTVQVSPLGNSGPPQSGDWQATVLIKHNSNRRAEVVLKPYQAAVKPA